MCERDLIGDTCNSMLKRFPQEGSPVVIYPAHNSMSYDKVLEKEREGVQKTERILFEHRSDVLESREMS
jgi:hypothetical protein